MAKRAILDQYRIVCFATHSLISGEGLESPRQAAFATRDDLANPEWANPSSWAPFGLVGEG
jgi:hypothetical protein